MAGEFYTAKTLERLACELLIRYQRSTDRALAAPIDAEDILDSAFADELSTPLWDAIPETPGRTVLAGLAPADRLIVLNERRRQLITDTQGLYNTTLAHEIAHWVLHVDRAKVGQPALPGLRYQLQFSCVRDDSSTWDEKNAHRYMAYLLMPRELLVPAAQALDLSSWPAICRLREQFGVTITSLTIRLEELGMAYVDRDGALHRSKQEARGQLPLL
jgi:hypothetical protein